MFGSLEKLDNSKGKKDEAQVFKKFLIEHCMPFGRSLGELDESTGKKDMAEILIIFDTH